jgi:DNA repair exonuclease SbcCD ATPase subunit
MLEAAFVAAHADGYGLYERGEMLERLRERLHHSRERSQEIERLLAERTTRLIAPYLAPSERATIAVELKQLAQERLELERTIDRLEDEHAAAEREYQDYRRRIAAGSPTREATDR